MDPHRRTRDDHASEIAEDYVEAIADRIRDRGICRASELATHFGVTAATVNNTVARLVRDGYAATRPYQPIRLTDRGRRLAARCRRRHATVRQFLIAMGVRESVADIDSEGIEHHVSEETLRAMARVMREGWPE